MPLYSWLDQGDRCYLPLNGWLIWQHCIAIDWPCHRWSHWSQCSLISLSLSLSLYIYIYTYTCACLLKINVCAYVCVCVCVCVCVLVTQHSTMNTKHLWPSHCVYQFQAASFLLLSSLLSSPTLHSFCAPVCVCVCVCVCGWVGGCVGGGWVILYYDYIK